MKNYLVNSDIEARLEAELEYWKSQPLASVRNVLVLERREQRKQYCYYACRWQDTTVSLNDYAILTDLVLTRDHYHVHLTTTSYQHRFDISPFLGSERGRISPERLSDWLDKGWAIELKEVPPTRLHAHLRSVHKAVYGNELFWVLTSSYVSCKVPYEVYRNDGSKVRKGSRLESSILGLEMTKFLPNPVNCKVEDN